MDIEAIEATTLPSGGDSVMETTSMSSGFDVDSVLQTGSSLSEDAFDELFRAIRSSSRIREQAGQSLSAAISSRGASLSSEAISSLKVAQLYYALANYASAVEWVEKAGEGVSQFTLKGRSLCHLGDYAGAISAFEAAESKGADSFDMKMAIADCLRCQGDLEGAEQHLQNLSRVGEIRAEYHYQLGRLHEANGRHGDAMDEYEQAVALDGEHTDALFHLAYATDIYGDEIKAVNYYERCINSGAVHVSALLNLAVLYEDVEDYSAAGRCVKQVLAAHPNHQRARMFLKDIEASKVMYYDEEQERRMDQCNQVLEIPITDFELSVRSRNCLKKMNIKYIGDLLRVTENELLAYKNFGETSLQEIRAILNQKNLRLGQLLEDRNNGLAPERHLEEEDEESNDMLNQPVSDLELSVRARKCLQRLNIDVIGDLTKRTEAELLGCKNFGQTSLVEIKQRLKERNLSLRELD
ncbi:MAG: tetratricopeptide repeat protein [Sedimentisphaerales bacterium]|nr:tetratricopeptide repeat protein [Sedimentisphaerales bacterium]